MPVKLIINRLRDIKLVTQHQLIKLTKPNHNQSLQLFSKRLIMSPKAATWTKCSKWFPVSNTNKLQIISSNKDPLSLHQDQLQKQVVNTIREVPETVL